MQYRLSRFHEMTVSISFLYATNTLRRHVQPRLGIETNRDRARAPLAPTGRHEPTSLGIRLCFFPRRDAPLGTAQLQRSVPQGVCIVTGICDLFGDQDLAHWDVVALPRLCVTVRFLLLLHSLSHTLIPTFHYVPSTLTPTEDCRRGGTPTAVHLQPLPAVHEALHLGRSRAVHRVPALRELRGQYGPLDRIPRDRSR